jgi:hypothetical protein
MIKAKCVNDFRAPKRKNNGIRFGHVYNIIRFIHNGKRVEVKEFPGVYYVPRRFEIIGKIIITLPDDLKMLSI